MSSHLKDKPLSTTSKRGLDEDYIFNQHLFRIAAYTAAGFGLGMASSFFFKHKAGMTLLFAGAGAGYGINNMYNDLAQFNKFKNYNLQQQPQTQFRRDEGRHSVQDLSKYVPTQGQQFKYGGSDDNDEDTRESKFKQRGELPKQDRESGPGKFEEKRREKSYPSPKSSTEDSGSKNEENLQFEPGKLKGKNLEKESPNLKPSKESPKKEEPSSKFEKGKSKESSKKEELSSKLGQGKSEEKNKEKGSESQKSSKEGSGFKNDDPSKIIQEKGPEQTIKEKNVAKLPNIKPGYREEKSSVTKKGELQGGVPKDIRGVPSAMADTDETKGKEETKIPEANLEKKGGLNPNKDVNQVENVKGQPLQKFDSNPIRPGAPESGKKVLTEFQSGRNRSNEKDVENLRKQRSDLTQDKWGKSKNEGHLEGMRDYINADAATAHEDNEVQAVLE